MPVYIDPAAWQEDVNGKNKIEPMVPGEHIINPDLLPPSSGGVQNSDESCNLIRLNEDENTIALCPDDIISTDTGNGLSAGDDGKIKSNNSYIGLIDTPAEYTASGTNTSLYWGTMVGVEETNSSPTGGRTFHTDRNYWADTMNVNTILPGGTIYLSTSVDAMDATTIKNRTYFLTGDERSPEEQRTYTIDCIQSYFYSSFKRDGYIKISNISGDPGWEPASIFLTTAEKVSWIGSPITEVPPHTSALIRYITTGDIAVESGTGLETETRAYLEAVYPYTSSSGVSSFVELSDTPNNYSATSDGYSASSKFICVDSFLHEVKYVDKNTIGNISSRVTPTISGSTATIRVANLQTGGTAQYPNTLRHSYYAVPTDGSITSVALSPLASTYNTNSFISHIIIVNASENDVTITKASTTNWARHNITSNIYPSTIPPNTTAYVILYSYGASQREGLPGQGIATGIIDVLYPQLPYIQNSYNANLEFATEDAPARFYVKEGMTHAVIEPASVSSDANVDLSGVSISINATYPNRDTVTTLEIDQAGVALTDQAGKNVTATINNWPTDATSVSLNVVFTE